MKQVFTVISAIVVTSLLLMACGSKESESEVPAIENETTVQEESTIETSESKTMTEESSIEESITEESTIEESESVTEELTYTITGLDKKMYVSKECNAYTEPYDTSVIFSGFNQGDLVQLTGEVVFTDNQDNNGVWYKFNIDGDEGYINAEYLTTENPNAQPEAEVAQQPQSQPETSQPEQQPSSSETTTTPEQQPSSSEIAQQSTTEQQPTQTETPSSGSSRSYENWNPDNIINPETGLPVQPGDEYWLDSDHETKVIVDDGHFFDDWGK